MADPIVIGGLVSLSMFTPAADVAGIPLASVVGIDQIYGGGYRISGTVKEKAVPNNLPLSRCVFLHLETTGAIVRSTWSDNSGNYAFDYLDGGKTYYVVAFDFANNYRAVVADNLTPEPM